MNSITDTYLFAHSIELRLALAVAAIAISFAAIKIVAFVGGAAKLIITKANSLGSSNQSGATYSPAGAL